jgi:hypothetical protein
VPVTVVSIAAAIIALMNVRMLATLFFLIDVVRPLDGDLLHMMSHRVI